MAVYLCVFIYVFVYLFKTNPGIYKYLWVAYKIFLDFTDFRISLITQLTNRLKQPSERDFMSKNGQNRLKNGEMAAKNVLQVQKQWKTAKIQKLS